MRGATMNMKLKYFVDQLATHPVKKYSKRPLEKIQGYVIHHFAGNITIEQAAEYHVNKGWPGIGYTIVIDLDGVAFLTNHLDTRSYGVAGNNTRFLSIALRGNWDHQLPPAQMLERLEEVTNLLDNVLGYKPRHVHSDFVNTACPGSELREWVRGKWPQPQTLRIKTSWYKRLFDKGHL